MRIELTSYDAIELTSKELIQSIHNNVYGECESDNDYIVSGVIRVLKNRLADPINGVGYVIDFINWNITTKGDGFCDMLTTENNFTEQQREIIRNYNGADAYVDAQKLEIFCDRLNGINAGEENYIRIFEGEDWEEIAGEIASE
mgnify:FL=1